MNISCLRSNLFPTVLLVLLLSATARAQFGTQAEEGSPVTDRQSSMWKVGVRVRATGGNCNGLYATLPVPTDWPDQKVHKVEERMSPHVKSVKYRMLDDGVQQMQVSIPRLPAGETAEVILEFEIDHSAVEPPTETDSLVIPRGLNRKIKRYLAASPFIESRHKDIRNLARELADEELTDWEQVEKFYDWVRENVTYENGSLKGALAALRDKTGDCEELTSLFIALCRAHGVPARTVWVPDHCYPEFYLEDAAGNGQWFPCQAAGTRSFGGMVETRPILQKGDNFKVPEKKQRQRYVSEYLTGKAGSGKPSVEFIREALAIDE